jgi:RecA-family ATPase
MSHIPDVAAKFIGRITGDIPAPVAPSPFFPSPLSYAEFNSEEGAEVLVEGGIVQREMLTMLSAPAKARKSWLLYDLAISLTLKKPWLGWSVKRPCKVLFVDLEVHPHSLQMRFKKIVSSANAGSPADKLIVLPWRHVSAQPSADVQAVVNEIMRLAGTGFDVIILDSIYLLLDGDESDPQAVSGLLRPIVGLVKATKAAVVFSHHYAKGSAVMQAGKSAIDRASGSSYWSRFADVLLPLSLALPDQNPDKRDLLIMEPEVRHHKRPQPLVLEWNVERFTFDATGEDAAALITPVPRKEREKEKKAKEAQKAEEEKAKVDPDKAAFCLSKLDKHTTEAWKTVPQAMKDTYHEGEGVNLPLSSWVPFTTWSGSCAKAATGRKLNSIIQYLLEFGEIEKREESNRLYYRSKSADCRA